MRTPVAVITCVFAAAATCTVAHAVDSPAGANSAATRSIQTCVQSSGHLLVLMLIDESGSLAGANGTDPAAKRVAGLKAALLGLRRLAETRINGKQPSVEVGMATFAERYRPLTNSARLPWTVVTPTSVRQLMTLANVSASRHSGLDTDYVTALLGARRDLNERAAELTKHGGQTPCTAIVWFTDGRYDIEPRKTDARRALGMTLDYAPGVRLDQPGGAVAAMKIGTTLMCRPRGLFDRLRADGTHILTVALDRGLDPAARSFLMAASTARPQGACGQRTKPPGAFLVASDPNKLVFLLGAPFDTAAQTDACPKQNGSRCSFTLFPGLSGFSVRASLADGTSGISLRTPKGQRVTFRSGLDKTARVVGTRFAAQWLSQTAVDVEGELVGSPRRWSGTWRIDLGEGPAWVQVRLRANAAAVAIRSPRAQRGRKATLVVQLADAAGRPLATSPLATGARLGVADAGATGTRVLPPKTIRPGRWEVTFTPPATMQEPTVILDLQAALRPIRGVTIETPTTQAVIHVDPPTSFPRVLTTSLGLPSLRGTGNTHGSIEVSGPSTGTGCVWVATVSVTSPSGGGLRAVGGSTPESEETCRSVGARETKSLSVAFHPSTSDEGVASGSVVLGLRANDGVSHTTSAVPVSFVMLPPHNAVAALEKAVLLTLVGLGFPLVLLVVLAWWAAKFEPATLVRYQVLGVELAHETGLHLVDQPSTTSPVLRDVGGSPRERRLTVPGMTDLTLTARFTRSRRDGWGWPIRLPYGVVEADGPVLAGAGRQVMPRLDVNRREIPLGLAGSWVIELVQWSRGEDARTIAYGRLLLFVPEWERAMVSQLAADAVEVMGRDGGAFLDLVGASGAGTQRHDDGSPVESDPGRPDTTTDLGAFWDVPEASD